MTARKALAVRCTACQHVWPAAWLPMPAMAAVAAMKHTTGNCPACGTRSNASRTAIVMATEAETVAARMRGWEPPQ